MGLKQIPTEIFIKYLLYLGLINVRVKASHFVFDYPDGHPKGRLIRPVILRANQKEIPVTHLHTNLFTIDPINWKKDFEIWFSKYSGSGQKK